MYHFHCLALLVQELLTADRFSPLYVCINLITLGLPARRALGMSNKHKPHTHTHTRVWGLCVSITAVHFRNNKHLKPLMMKQDLC